MKPFEFNANSSKEAMIRCYQRTGDDGLIEIDAMLQLHGHQAIKGYSICFMATPLCTGIKRVYIDTNRNDFVFKDRAAVTASEVGRCSLSATLMGGAICVNAEVYLGTFTLMPLDESKGYNLPRIDRNQSLLCDGSGQPISYAVMCPE